MNETDLVSLDASIQNLKIAARRTDQVKDITTEIMKTVEFTPELVRAFSEILTRLTNITFAIEASQYNIEGVVSDYLPDREV